MNYGTTDPDSPTYECICQVCGKRYLTQVEDTTYCSIDCYDEERRREVEELDWPYEEGGEYNLYPGCP